MLGEMGLEAIDLKVEKSQFFLNAIHIVGLQGQGIISEKNQAKITRNAEREAKYYLKKGYQVYDSTEDLENSLRSYYRYKFSENETGNRIYVVPISMSREKNLEDAVSSARLKSGQSTLGLMQLYFNSWIRTDERTSENDIVLNKTRINLLQVLIG